MTAFSFTSGNPADLTSGGDAEMVDIQGPFNDLRSFLNGGTMDETNVPNLAAAFTTWKPVPGGVTGGQIPTQGAGGTVLLPGGMAPNGAQVAATTAAGTAVWSFWFNPADFLANSRTTKLRIRWDIITNNVASATSYTAGLYPISAVGAASGSFPAVTIGTVVTGSTAGFTTPGASTSVQSTSTEFNAPSAGRYIFGCVIGAAMAAGSTITIGGLMEYRQV